MRSDADIDLCWRIQQAGAALEDRPDALVVHRNPERLGAMLRQHAGYGAGRRWFRGLHGAAVVRPTILAPLARGIGGALVGAITLHAERSLFKLLDGAAAAAVWWGYVTGDNRA